MIVIDTSVWIDHLREADPTLIALLGDGRQRVHPFVIGELALGSLRDRTTVLTLLERMPSAPIAEPDDVITSLRNRPCTAWASDTSMHISWRRRS